MRISILLLVSVTAASCANADATKYQGACDASAVVQLDTDHFVAATDERNTLRVYDFANKTPVAELALDEFLQTERKGKYREADIEGGTKLGDTTFWITSHGRNGEAEERPERQRLFAVGWKRNKNVIILEPVGKSYCGLLQDLFDEPSLAKWNLKEAAGKAPQSEGGLNIEAICGKPDGALWIGFRSPLDHGRALLVEIKNPRELTATNQKERAQFGTVRALDLGGRGVRDLAVAEDGYMILAGTSDDRKDFALFHWKGGEDAPVRVPAELNQENFAPEGLLIDLSRARALVFSDDDSVEINGVRNKDIKNDEDREFGARPVSLAP